MSKSANHSPQDSTTINQSVTFWNRILIFTAVAGLAMSSVCLYTAFTYPIVRPPNWSGGIYFRVLMAIAKWGSVATIAFGTTAFMKSPKSWMNRVLFASSFSPAVTVLGLYGLWLILFA